MARVSRHVLGIDSLEGGGFRDPEITLHESRSQSDKSQLIESIAINSVSYDLARQTLVDRASDDYLLKKRHLQGFFDIPSAKKESATSLHAIVHEFQRYSKIFGELGKPTGSWSSMVEHLLYTKIHDDTLKA